MPVLKWLSKVAQSAFDPNREARVKQLESHILNELKNRGKNFSITQVQLTSDFAQADLDDAAERVFRNAINRAFDDNIVTKQENARLTTLANILKLEPAKVKSLRMMAARASFETVLAASMEDGVIDEKEKKHLVHIAAQAGCSLEAFASTFLKNECESFLRSIFLAAINDGDLSTTEWNNLISTIEMLGLSQDEFFRMVRHQGQAFVEHVLADAKADDSLSEVEEEKLLWLVSNLKLPNDYVHYVTQEVAKVKRLQQIESGILPSLPTPNGLEMAGGELVHAQVQCNFHHIRKLKNGIKNTTHSGVLVITDRKTVFVSETKSFRLSYRSILGHSGNENQIRIQAQGKPEILLEFWNESETIYPVFKAALAIANQTKTARLDGKKSRHISRDVRQTVWRRYGGRCADCNADDYLEFDHIIPVAKGGSNSEANVQLLCRRCNNKKSDKI